MGGRKEDDWCSDEAVKYAEEHGDYQDHTLTLRTSNDYDVDKDGLTLKNEAEYASFVESKGFDCLVVPLYMRRND